MTETTERPLVTFVVIAYNQERFIREAIEGAFAQTYEPLEIILSDDCSPDGTFEIMQEMAAAYKGPHKVVLNCNEPNLGLVPHIDRAMELVSGEFIVVNAGDDISVPDRTERLASAWLESQKTLSLVHSAVMSTTAERKPIGLRRPPERIIKTPTPRTIIAEKSHVIGASAAWSREVFDKYGPLGRGLSTEDRIIPFRASALGGIGYIDEPLVLHNSEGISGSTGNLSATGYLYGISHKLRKWDTEIDLYICREIEKFELPEGEDIKETCHIRAEIVGFQVALAEARYVERVAMIFRAFHISYAQKTLRPIKDWLRYTFDGPYIACSDWRIKQGQKQKSAVSQAARDA